MGSVLFFFEDLPILPELNEHIVEFLNKIIVLEGFTCQSLNYIISTDDYLYQINVHYLDHHYYTDVITFDNSESPLIISGDIFISLDRVKDNAILHCIPYFNELLRVMIHGLLHLIGYDDKTSLLKEDMTQRENFYLDIFA